MCSQEVCSYWNCHRLQPFGWNSEGVTYEFLLALHWGRITHLVYLILFSFSYFAGFKGVVSARPFVRPPDPDTTTINALEAVASSRGKNVSDGKWQRYVLDGVAGNLKIFQNNGKASNLANMFEWPPSEWLWNDPIKFNYVFKHLITTVTRKAHKL